MRVSLRRSLTATFAVVLAVLGAAPLATQAAGPSRFAPLDQRGPKLTVAKQKLRASVECSADVRDARTQPVLLLPATGVDSEQNFAWNYERAFEQEGIPYCTSDQPQNKTPGGRDSNLGNIQLRGQYVTYAIRRVSRLSGRRIATLGHSQGGMVMRWSLRFWPDTRERVAEVIGMAGSNHGTRVASSDCGSCPAANAQQAADSRFIRALNSRAETFRGISYTEIYTRLDEVVTPNADDSGSSSVRGGGGRITNVATQDVCAANTAEHFQIGTTDPVAYALVEDALTHAGPAKPSRIDGSVCTELFQPGVNPLTVAADAGAAASGLAANNAAARMVDREPRLRCYVFGARAPKRCR